MACGAGSFTRDTFHSAAIAEKGKGMVINDLEAGLVEVGSSGSLRNSKPNGIGEALTQGTRSDLDTRSILGLWVAWCDAINALGDQRIQLCIFKRTPRKSLGTRTRKAFRSSIATP